MEKGKAHRRVFFIIIKDRASDYAVDGIAEAVIKQCDGFAE